MRSLMIRLLTLCVLLSVALSQQHSEPLNCGDVVALKSQYDRVAGSPFVHAEAKRQSDENLEGSVEGVKRGGTNAVSVTASVAQRDERFIAVCYGKREGEVVKFGDTIALRKLRGGDVWLSDQDDTSARDLHQSLVDTTGKGSERKRVFLTVRNSALPEPGDEFTVFNGASGDLNDRGVVGDNSTVVLRTLKLQTVSVESPVRGLDYRKRLELRALGADELGTDSSKMSFPVESRFWLRVLCATNGGALCSGRGVCKAGKCECSIEYDGIACEHKRKFGFCHVTGDPHVQTFDRKRFNVFSEGEVLAYANPDSRNNEAVTVSMKKVKSTITSVVRKVAFRQGNAIVTIGSSNFVQVNCGKNMARRIRARGEAGLIVEGTNLEIRWQKEAKRWRVSSGDSGVVLWVKSYEWGLSAWIRVFTVPRGAARGLCGNFDGDMSNDIGPSSWPLEPHLQPNRHFISSLSLPEDRGLVECTAPKIDFSSIETHASGGGDIVSASHAGDDIVVGELSDQETEEEIAQRAEQAKALLADADSICGNSARRNAAHRKCECRGFNNVATFHLFADCVLDECETSSTIFVKSNCDAEKTDADEAQRIHDYQEAIDQLELSQELSMQSKVAEAQRKQQ